MSICGIGVSFGGSLETVVQCLNESLLQLWSQTLCVTVCRPSTSGGRSCHSQYIQRSINSKQTESGEEDAHHVSENVQ